MKTLDYVPTVRVSYTRREATVIIECATKHYDGRCRSEAYRGGVAHRMLALVREKIDTGNITLRSFEVDLLAKITELGAPDLSSQFSAILQNLNRLFLKNNDE